MEGINAYLNDCIFFSQFLEKEISAYGKRLRKFRFNFLGRRTPKIDKADWSQAKEEGLLPDPENYKSWTQGFKEHESLMSKLKTKLSRNSNK